MQPKNIAVLIGGPSAEHDISVQTGEAVVAALRAQGHRVRSVVVQNEREAFEGEAPELLRADVVFNALHGEWGESGQVQAALEQHGIFYTGSGPAASALGMDKLASRHLFLFSGLAMPRVLPVHADMANADVREHALRAVGPLPWVVKPQGRGSSVGVSVIAHDDELIHALAYARAFDRRVVIEEFLDGPEVSCGVLEYPAGHPQALPPTLIVPPLENGFFDYDAKYSGTSEEITPAPFRDDVMYAIQQAALDAFAALGCRHYARVDMFLQDDIPYVIELNTLPGLTPKSIIPKQARAVGFSFPPFIEHLIALALI